MNELTDDSSSVPLEPIPLIYNKNFFEGVPDEKPVPQSSSSSRKLIHFSGSTSKQKRGERYFVCKWCERKVSSLLFEVGCVPECVISYFYAESPQCYDLTFIEICTYPLFEQDNIQPVRLPPRDYTIHETVKDYWTDVLDRIYHEPTDVRKRILLMHLSKNSINRTTELDEKEFHQAVKQKK